jgi:hypothetical protein
MYKNILKLIITLGLALGIAQAEVIDLNGKVKGIDVSLKSANELSVGNNDFYVTLAKDGMPITDAKVKVKFFMPEMPGMPYMEYKQKAKLVDGKYKMNINLSMGGTWQYQLRFKTSDGKKYKIRGSVNL